MIIVESRLPNEHRARGFFRELADPRTASAIIAEQHWDDDDRAREPVLRRILAQANVSAVAYPTTGHRDVLQVFLRDGDGSPVFACVLVSGARLRDMLAQSSPVVEGFALQVLPSEQLSVESMRAGLQSWIERCFPDLVLPSLVVERWTGPEGLLYELLELLLSRPDPIMLTMISEDADQVDELRPDPGLAQPPYELAA
jgi:hypothetical protein